MQEHIINSSKKEQQCNPGLMWDTKQTLGSVILSSGSGGFTKQKLLCLSLSIRIVVFSRCIQSKAIGLYYNMTGGGIARFSRPLAKKGDHPSEDAQKPASNATEPTDAKSGSDAWEQQEFNNEFSAEEFGGDFVDTNITGNDDFCFDGEEYGGDFVDHGIEEVSRVLRWRHCV